MRQSLCRFASKRRCAGLCHRTRIVVTAAPFALPVHQSALAEPLDRSSITLGRPSMSIGLGRPGKATHVALAFAREHAVFGFGVQRGGYRCRTTALGDALDDQGTRHRANDQIDAVARAYFLGRLHPQAIDLRVAALHRFSSQRSGFVETGGPQPLVDPNPLARRLAHGSPGRS